MSRHHVHTQLDGRQVFVVAGYDRPLRELFLQVLSDDGDPQAEEAVLYSSTHEPLCDWRDFDTLTQALAELGLTLPAGMLDAIRGDQVLNAGNRIVVHHFDQPPELLLAG
jgi:hypothetical protein